VLNDNLDVLVDYRMPSAQLLRSIVRAQPMQGRVLRDWMKQFEAGDRRRMMEQIRIGLVQGESVRNISRRIFGTSRLQGRDGARQITRRGADILARTTTNAILNKARTAFAEENKDLIQAEVYTATLDSRTTIQCASLDGRRFPVGKGPIPPIHIRAVAHDSMISTELGPITIQSVRVGDRVLTHRGRFMPVYAAMSKPCDVNRIFRIDTKAGGVLSVTDEHPVLARGRGWIRADQVEVGDQLFHDPEQEAWLQGLPCVVSETDNYPSPFDEPLVPYHVTFESGSMAPTINLKSDMRGYKAEVDNTSGFDVLMSAQGGAIDQSLTSEYFQKWPFSNRRIGSMALGASGIHHGKHRRIGAWIARLHALARSPRAFGVLFGHAVARMISPDSTFDIAATGTQAVQATANLDPMLFAEIGYFPRSDLKLPPDLSQGSVVAPVLGSDNLDQGRRVNHWIVSDVISITRLPYSQPLYNLGVIEDETYVADGILVHNCRSTRVPAIDGGLIGRRPAKPSTERELLQEYAQKNKIRAPKTRDGLPRGHKGRFDDFSRSRVRALTGQVPASQSYATWLRDQTTAFQDEVLGPTRARLFRQGKITMDKFVDRTGKPYTLDDLMRREPEAFQ